MRKIKDCHLKNYNNFDRYIKKKIDLDYYKKKKPNHNDY